MSEKTIFQLRIVKTNMGWMVEDEDFDYVCDAKGDNVFDSIAQAYEAMELHLDKQITKRSRSSSFVFLTKTTEFSTRVVENSTGFCVLENGEEGYVNGPDGRCHFSNSIHALNAMKRYIEIQHKPLKEYNVRLFATESYDVKAVSNQHAIDQAMALAESSQTDWELSDWNELRNTTNAS